MSQLNRRIVAICFGLGSCTCFLLLMYRRKPEDVSPPINKPVITCQPEDFKDTPFIKELRKNDTVTIPSEKTLETLSREELSALYHRYIENLQYFCRRRVRLGKIEDGGWDICDEQKFRPRAEQQPCLVYSFGINYDFSFDEAAAQYYGCEVHSFDPSMDTEDFTKDRVHFHKLGISSRDEISTEQWTLLRYNTIRKRLGHTERKISVLKVDIEHYEWTVIPDILTTSDLTGTTNLVIEFHLEMSSPEQDRPKYFLALKILKNLYDAGFRIFWTHQNKWCQFVSKCKKELRTNCHEVNFVKVP